MDKIKNWWATATKKTKILTAFLLAFILVVLFSGDLRAQEQFCGLEAEVNTILAERGYDNIVLQGIDQNDNLMQLYSDDSSNWVMKVTGINMGEPFSCLVVRGKDLSTITGSSL